MIGALAGRRQRQLAAEEHARMPAKQHLLFEVFVLEDRDNAGGESEGLFAGRSRDEVLQLLLVVVLLECATRGEDSVAIGATPSCRIFRGA